MKQFLIILICIYSLTISLSAEKIISERLNPAQFISHIDSLSQTEIEFTIIDVRTPREFSSGYIKNAILIDYYNPNFQEELDKLARDRIYLVYCGSGVRSKKALIIMNQLGFMHVYDLKGGMKAWKEAKLPVQLDKATKP